MSGTSESPPLDPQAVAAVEEEAKKQAEQQGSSVLGDVADAALGVVDLATTVVEGVASAIGGLFDI
jgi:hypothetical protein